MPNTIAQALFLIWPLLFQNGDDLFRWKVRWGIIGQVTTLQQTSGKLNFLRVHDVGTGYGPATDKINVEVVVQLDGKPGYAFGFQLRNDQNRPVRQGMLDLLRDAFNNNWDVTIDYEIANGNKNGIIRRIWLTKQPAVGLDLDAMHKE